MAFGSGILKYARALCFPEACVSCRTLLDWQTPHTYDASRALCESCMRAWVSETLETCGNCARRVGKCDCMSLVLREAKCEGFCKLTYYEPRKDTPVQNRMIYTIKRKGAYRIENFLARELALVIKDRLDARQIPLSEVVVTFAPRSRRSVLFYGVDQAKQLSRALASTLGVEHMCLIERRRGANVSQKGLSLPARCANAKRSFAPSPRADCRGKTVVLMDDVLTTGATLAACTRILRKMGAKHVLAAAVGADIAHKDSANSAVIREKSFSK